MIDLALSPLTWLVLGTLIGLARGCRWLAWTGTGIALVAIAVMTPFTANLLVHVVEARTNAPAGCASTAATDVVVLAGGVEREPKDETDVGALAAVGERRLFAAITQLRQLSGGRLLIVGGGDFRVPESRILASLARSLGVPADAIDTETTSTTTWENATHAAALRKPPQQRFRLVTSALHMPRALLAFRAAGFDPCPITTDSIYKAPGSPGYYLPQTSALRKSEEAIHEIVGMLAYEWRASHRKTREAALPEAHADGVGPP